MPPSESNSSCIEYLITVTVRFHQASMVITTDIITSITLVDSAT